MITVARRTMWNPSYTFFRKIRNMWTTVYKVNELLTPPDLPPHKYRSINNDTGAAASSKCSVCQGNHSKLFHCFKLLSYIWGGNFKTLCKLVCNVCVSSDPTVTSPECHNKLKVSPFKCGQQNIHQLICGNCPQHTALHDYFKANYDQKLGLQNMTNFTIFNKQEQ